MNIEIKNVRMHDFASGKGLRIGQIILPLAESKYGTVVIRGATAHKRSDGTVTVIPPRNYTKGRYWKPTTELSEELLADLGSALQDEWGKRMSYRAPYRRKLSRATAPPVDFMDSEETPPWDET